MKTIHTLLACGVAMLCSAAAAQTAASPAPDPGNAPQPTPRQSVTEQQTVTELQALPADGVSQVRIVRLSQIAGKVYMDRKTGRHFEEAFVNLPIVAGSALLTRDGVAEVEFEDNSSLRLTPNSLVEFPQLGREAAGAVATAVHVRRGSVYVSLASGKNVGAFRMNVGGETVVVAPGSHLRLDLNEPTARILVYQGSASVTGPWGSMAVPRHRAVSFDIAASASPVFVRASVESPFDAWDRNAVEYHKVRAATAAAFAGSPYSYGLSDLNYYGSFSNVGGCGTMWRPYLASAAWDPYGSGVWTWYPGQGYSWVSLYPWGWMPFHSGEWNYCQTGGWGWRPNGNWNGLSNHPNLAARTPWLKWPVAPAPPHHGEATVIAVNVKSLSTSHMAEDGRFVLRADSAGLGVPRGSFSNLGKISERAEVRGTAVTTLSEHQMAVGLMAPSRSSSSGASFSPSYAGRSSSAQTATASSYSHATSAASNTPAASSSFVSSGGSFSTASASSVGSSSAGSASAAAHH